MDCHIETCKGFIWQSYGPPVILLSNICDNVKAILLLRIVTINYVQTRAVARMALQDTLIHLL